VQLKWQTTCLAAHSPKFKPEYHTHTCMHTCTQTLTFTCMHSHTPHMHTNSHTLTLTRTHTTNTHTHTCTYHTMHILTHTHARVYTQVKMANLMLYVFPTIKHYNLLSANILKGHYRVITCRNITYDNMNTGNRETEAF
jgi:hypothetical protein